MIRFGGVMLFLVVLCGSVSQAQSRCCVCQLNQYRFKAQIPEGFSASFACNSLCSTSGGIWQRRVEACVVPLPKPPTPEPESCLRSIDGGDCKGNAKHWCTCKLAAFTRKGPENVHVGDEVAVHINTAGFGGSVSHTGTNRDELSSSMTIYWGDGKQEMLALGEKDATHKYTKPGNYTARLVVWGAYHWSVEEGSCSFECQTESSKNDNSGNLNFNVTEKENPKPTKAAAKVTH
jgi:hypothetical protein